MGVLLMSSAISSSSPCVHVRRSVVRGRYLRMTPLRFSTVPFSHEWYGWQKKKSVESCREIFACSAFSGPLSAVMLATRSCSSRPVIAAVVAFASFAESFVMMTFRLMRSASTFTPSRYLQSMESVSQCPSSLRSLAPFERASMNTRPSSLCFWDFLPFFFERRFFPRGRYWYSLSRLPISES